METSLPIAYLSIFLILLAVSAWFIFRQVLKTRRSEAVFSQLQKKLKSNKGTAQEYYELGCLYSDKKLYSQAIQLFQKSLKCDDIPEQESALVYNALGYAYVAKEQYDLAIRQYKEALKMAPAYVIAFNNIGFAYEKKNLIRQALQSYDQALKIDPNNKTAKTRANSLKKRLTPSE
ncbi:MULTISPECIES: tetratricopeptide repeat protein [unclassified Roseofilum]|uniref:tetratricopeptide repeat protein n=1 Tax=unclassified Roseofilum TaxID=2620099 RepID=UPI000E946E31|nr:MULTISPECIES: tetratricopeptide repeat protein [unclassified Roseofilum]HBQ98055.1 hypothetical protein [Cyanobacteria bacterium UBA11691]MBP0010642.1 tetratricopeptide repeat protein [Roseofilum sp. Belize Diploria]MBP0012150.1 tetratricopeptide repeat protein [Roseofilum sp. SID3]MBP0025818.1 tetratricopeptide repeat protein [Roseofilum sp. SID2]MBP0034563.1 tetratricopeptide repeat protein [Roseofilum sp. Belize BBD 4]